MAMWRSKLRLPSRLQYHFARDRRSTIIPKSRARWRPRMPWPTPAEAHGTLAGALCALVPYRLEDWLAEILPEGSIGARRRSGAADPL